jgi:tetratricopeptide (TPR) repeat protein
MDARSTMGASPPNPRLRRSTRLRPSAWVLVGLAVLLGARICRADDAAEFELAKSRFDAGKYDEAHDRLAVLVDPQRPTCDHGPSGGCRIADADLLERARSLDAAALIALKRIPEAEAEIETILRANPTYVPNPALFPQEVVDRFTEVRGRLRDELAKEAADRAAKALKAHLTEQQIKEADEKWIGDLEQLAGAERVVEKHSRWIAALPLGIGQYQNGDIALGIVFSVSQVLLGATSVTGAAIVSSLAGIDTRNCPRPCLAALAESTKKAKLVNQISFGAWIGATVIGVVQAQIAFVPEKVTMRPRPIPPRPKVTPSVSILPGGAALGLVGQF